MPLQPTPSGGNTPGPRRARIALVTAGVALAILIASLWSPRDHTESSESPPIPARQQSLTSTRPQSLVADSVPALASHRTPPQDPEAIVARKLSQFARSRRALAEALAKKKGIVVPAAVEQFFAAVEGGNWDEIHAAFQRINGGDSSASHAQERDPDVSQLWPVIIDAFGVAEQVHEWPARELLEYGESVLASLRPGMVYVGGTDNGRWIPELINETSDGERHIIITQNGLADNSYLDYLELQYGDRFETLASADSEKVFKDYVADAQRRLKHDQEHPDEPRQVRPGEDLAWKDGSFQVSGSTAVMAINEKLLQNLIALNPELPFALQESFPLRGTYGEAAPLGPIMELNARTEHSPFTADLATQSVELWNRTAERILDPGASPPSESARKSYSHDAVAAANLLAFHEFDRQAEEAYRTGLKLWPANPESAAGLASLLNRAGRTDEATQLINRFRREHPDQAEHLDRIGLSSPPQSPSPKP